MISIAIHPEDLAKFSVSDRQFMEEALGETGGVLVEDQSMLRGQMLVSRVLPPERKKPGPKPGRRRKVRVVRVVGT